MSAWLAEIIGRDAQTILWWQMMVRAALAFLFLLLLIRVGGKRMFGRMGAVDIAVAILLGSTLSRAVTANARFLPTVAACAVLVLLHALLAQAAFRSPRIGRMVKGTVQHLVAEGGVQPEEMRQAQVTDEDLMEELRLSAGTCDVGTIRDAYLERSGRISFIRR